MKIKTNSKAAQAIAKVGNLKLPISKGSKEKSLTKSCVPNKSGQSCWYLLESGHRVCVQYKDWKPIMWLGLEKVNNNGTTVFEITD